MTVGDTEDNKTFMNQLADDAIDDLTQNICQESCALRLHYLRRHHKNTNKSEMIKTINRIKTLCEELEAHV